MYLQLFKQMLGSEEWVKKPAFFKEQHYYLNEQDIAKNMPKVLGVAGEGVQYFSKLFYLYMSKGFDKSKIGMSRMIECLDILASNDVNSSHNKMAFALYDLDRDGCLNILNLVTLQKNF